MKKCEEGRKAIESVRKLRDNYVINSSGYKELLHIELILRGLTHESEEYINNK